MISFISFSSEFVPVFVFGGDFSQAHPATVLQVTGGLI
jgi:hypothetical protein